MKGGSENLYPPSTSATGERRRGHLCLGIRINRGLCLPVFLRDCIGTPGEPPFIGVKVLFCFVLLLCLLFEHLSLAKPISINTQCAFLKAIDFSTNIYIDLSAMNQRSHS